MPKHMQSTASLADVWALAIVAAPNKVSITVYMREKSHKSYTPFALETFRALSDGIKWAETFYSGIEVIVCKAKN